MTSRLSLLKDIQAYSDLTQSGNEALKSSLWQIIKLRRKQIRGSLTMESNLSAKQLREELRPQVIVKNQGEQNMKNYPSSSAAAGDKEEEGEEEPDLISEGSLTPPPPTSSSKSSSLKGKKGIPQWEIINAVTERASANKENPTTKDTNSSSTATTTGLRQRKNKTNNNESNGPSMTSTETMKMEPVVGQEEAEEDLDEEERLWQRDPLELFGGIRPHDLKLAQQRAKEALDSYIQAANLAAIILGQLPTPS